MKEAEFLGALLPSHPDFLPIIEAVKDKYKLPEKYPDDDPIEEIYFEDEIISLEEFRQDIRTRVLENMKTIFPENFVKRYEPTKKLVETKEIPGFDRVPDDLKPTIEVFFTHTKNMAEPIFKVLDAQIDSVTNMIYIYLLTGETEEAPSDWFGKVAITQMFDETIVIALAGELTNIDDLTSQIRQQHKKAFGVKVMKKLTNTIVSTAYYVQLKRSGASWNLIVEEYIRRNKVNMPLRKNSYRYTEIWKRNEAKLKKRMQRTEKILDVILGDKK